MSWFEGKHALVTGGGTGIGAAIARVLKDKGARVTISGRNEDRLKAAAEDMGVAYAGMDVTDRTQVRAVFDDLAASTGTVEILINNAGAAEAAPFAKMSDEHWDWMLSVNLTGVYNCSRAAIGSMLEQQNGTIVNVASTAGLKGYGYIAAYCAAKHGVIGMTRALALEYADKGITVNAVCPGYTDTDIARDAIDKSVATTGRSPEQAMAEIVNSTPPGRLVQPEEVADVVMWLCRQPSMNGQAIAIAGGEVM